MGYYINPEDMTKEQFLSKHGTRVTAGVLGDHDFSSDELPVCLVDNGWMTAAGICYDRREIMAFAQPDDKRPKNWFLVKKELLKPWLPEKFHV